MSEPRLNSAGIIARTFVDSKLTPLFVVAILLLALFAALNTPREENPQILVPGAQVTFELPGATSTEVERLIVAPMEARLREIEGIEHSYAAAMPGMGRIQLQFFVGTDKDAAINRVRQKVAEGRHLLPAATKEPLIQQVDADDVAIVTVTLASNRYDDYALRRLAERIGERLNTIEEVSVTQIHGGREREIRVNLDPARLQAFGVTMNEGIAMVAASNVSAVVGDLVGDGQRRSVYLRGRLPSLEEIRRLPLGAHRGQLIYLEDIGDVVDGPVPERDALTRLAFGPGDPRYSADDSVGEMASVTVSVAKKPHTNSVRVSRDILEQVAKMKAQFVPAGVEVVTTRDDGQIADHTVNSLIFELAIAVAAVMLVLIPFLGLRQAMIVCLAVPLVLGLTLTIDMLTGFTINRISLFALIMSLGMLVDDAIVVMENIHRHYEQGTTDRLRSAVLATHEIGTPTTMATITIVLAFASLSQLSGMNGAFFKSVSVNVSVAVGLSLLLAFLVVPWASQRWLPRSRHAPVHAATGHSPMQRLYIRIITPFLDDSRRRRWLFVGVGLALVASLMMPAWQFIRPAGISGPLSFGGVGLAIMPVENHNTFSATLDMPESTPIEVTDRVAREFGKLVGRHPMVTNYLSYVGMPGVLDFAGQVNGAGARVGANQAEIRINLIDKAARKTGSRAVLDELRVAAEPLLARHPGLELRFFEAPPGPPTVATVLANIHGPDPEVLRAFSARVKQEFQKTYGMVDVYDSEVADAEQFDIVVDKEKAVLSGVTTADIEQTIRALMAGVVVAEVQIPGEKNPVPLRIRVPRQFEVDPALLDRTLVRNRNGDAVPVSELTHLVKARVDRPLLRKDNEPVSYVGGNVIDISAPAYAILDMDRRLDGLEVNGERLTTGNLTLEPQIPNTVDGYQLLWDGEIRVTLDVFRDMSQILGVVVVLIFLVLVANYRSFTLPLVGMTAIPLGMIGVFPGHWLVGIKFSMTSMIGVVALAGLVVRNSLLIIDFIHDHQREGHGLREAVQLAGAVRLRPILLTSAAMILGVLVLFRDPLFIGLATSLLFGTIASTVLTLLALPPLYYRLAKSRPEWVQARGSDTPGLHGMPEGQH
ncbi:multidrug efflux pump subunit AcrB [Panacagrimonas perspica]|uniref:Multidrug efflux pump subunit AcrB n=1 Tax=Panacagrimonas perspica TaxID=381431 RepID=A0A4S3K8B4_9GAMM|nr:efflux RND transporter permease subunit [Panacagrimonas perspica]TDU31982.1 multidrug efflux pump subunit AcrB [Panacagrimonas perspica]THD04480.1 acriflavin resistance protein [Panacagrimonas perspica]